MDPQAGIESSVALADASEVTIGLFSWLEDLSVMWEAWRRGEDIRVPGVLLLWMYLTAAMLAAGSCFCDLLSREALDWHRTRRLERQTAKLLRRGDLPTVTPNRTR